MAQIRYRANLSAKDFVFSSQNWGRSVILKQYDQNFSRQIVSPTDPDKDIGIPQIFYGHNIMPASQGFQSVGVKQIIPDTAVLVDNAYQILSWQNGTTGLKGYFLITYVSQGPVSITFNIYTWTISVSTQWTFQRQVNVPNTNNNAVYYVRFTTALIAGLTYLYAPQLGCYSYDGTTFSDVTLTGLTASQIIGICAAFGYMVAWSSNAVSWSSTISATDFTPSLITGAGGGGVNNVKGQISFCVPHVFGFVIFSQFNCVSAVYSGNTRYPFNFREVIGCGGINGPAKLVDLDSESGNLYAYTSSGLQIVSVTQAQVVHPEVTNFISGSRFEDFNDTTLQFLETDVTIGTFNKQLSVIANRYLVISYGITNTFPLTFTHALVYDISMKRWGKLRFTHVQVLEGLISNTLSQDNARDSLCFLDPVSNIWQVDFSQLATTGGTIVLGKYQHARDRLITLQQVDLEYIQNINNLKVYDLVTYDGKTFQAPSQLTPIATVGNAPQYPARLTGMNHSILIQGQFMLDSLMLTYTINGRR